VFNAFLVILVISIFLIGLIRIILSDKRKDQYQANNSFRPSISNKKAYQTNSNDKVEIITIKGHKFSERESSAIIEAIKNQNKVEAIWLIRSVPGINLNDANEFVEIKERIYFLTDNQNTKHASKKPNNPDEKKVNVKTVKLEISSSQFYSLKVALEQENKIVAINILRKECNLELQEAKDLIDQVLIEMDSNDITKEIIDNALIQISQKSNGGKFDLTNMKKDKPINTNLSDANKALIIKSLENGNKIEAVKLYSDATGLGWSDASIYVQKLENSIKPVEKKIAILKSPIKNEDEGEYAEEVYEYTEEKSVLEETDKKLDLADKIIIAIDNGHKIEAIKILRDATGLGLKEARDLVEKIDSQIKRASNNTDALVDIHNFLSEELHGAKGAKANNGLMGNWALGLDDKKVNSIMRALNNGNKIEAIKLLRQYKGYDLKLSKDIIDSIDLKNK
jgi:ribosomal protein L7/L12